MVRKSISIDELEKELDFSTSTSGGPGGQNVNRVQTKVTLRFDIVNSEVLADEEKDVILKKLASKITKEGVLVISAQEKRSQLQNKEAVIKKAEVLINGALTKKKARKPTKPSKAAMQKRISSKKQHAEKKKWRQSPLR